MKDNHMNCEIVDGRRQTEVAESMSAECVEDSLRSAQEYREELDELMGGGFARSQAELAIDLRRDDERRYQELVAGFMSMGDDCKEASVRAASFLDLVDTKRLDLIKTSGVSTLYDYGRILKSE